MYISRANDCYKHDFLQLMYKLNYSLNIDHTQINNIKERKIF